MSRSSTYIKAIGSGYLATAATILVGFWLTPYTLRHLDREEFAIFTLANDLLMWLGLLDIGITSGLNVKAAHLYGRPNSEALNKLTSTAFYTQNIIVAILLIVGILLALSVPKMFELRPDLRSTAVLTMLILVLSTAVGFSTKTFSALLIAHQQLHIDNALRLLLLGIRTTLIIVLLKADWGLYALASATLTATLVTSGLAVARTYRLLPHLEISWHHFSWDLFRNLGGLGLWFTLGALAGVVVSSVDRFVAANLVSVESVTTLSLTSRLYLLGRSALDPISNTARPMLSQLLGQGDQARASSLHDHITAITRIAAIVAAGTIFACNKSFVSLWVGVQHYGGWTLDAALALSFLASSWVLPQRAILTAALYKVPHHAISRLITAATAAALSTGLSLQLGLAGAALGIAVGELSVSVWYLPFLVGRFFGSCHSSSSLSSLPRILLISALVATASVVTRRIFLYDPVSLATVALPLVLSGSFGVVCAWFLALSPTNRSYIFAKLPLPKKSLPA